MVTSKLNEFDYICLCILALGGRNLKLKSAYVYVKVARTVMKTCAS